MNSQLVYFITYCLVGGIILHQLLRGLHKLYKKMWINHHPSKEALVTKIFLLCKYNSILVLAAVGVTIFYSIFISGLFPDSSQITVQNLVIIGVIFGVLNTTLRLATYGYIERDREDSEEKYEIDMVVAIERKGLFLRSYLSFIYSLVLFAFIGIGVTIGTGTGISTTVFEGVSPGEAAYYSFSVIFVIFILSASSEVLLWIGPFSVPEYLSD